LLARRLAHLTVASPSLFVLIGVVFFLLHSTGESAFWWGLWVSALLATAFPFDTGWMGENHFSALPSAAYGLVLVMAAIEYLLLQQAIIRS
jgi:uncharacterized membrane protein